jgi:hypothetical protein
MGGNSAGDRGRPGFIDQQLPAESARRDAPTASRTAISFLPRQGARDHQVERTFENTRSAEPARPIAHQHYRAVE